MDGKSIVENFRLPKAEPQGHDGGRAPVVGLGLTAEEIAQLCEMCGNIIQWIATSANHANITMAYQTWSGRERAEQARRIMPLLLKIARQGGGM